MTLNLRTAASTGGEPGATRLRRLGLTLDRAPRGIERGMPTGPRRPWFESFGCDHHPGTHELDSRGHPVVDLIEPGTRNHRQRISHQDLDRRQQLIGDDRRGGAAILGSFGQDELPAEARAGSRLGA